MTHTNYGKRRRDKVARERLDKHYQQALAHYRNVCFFQAQGYPGNDGWEEQALILAARYMSIWYGVKV